GCFARELSLVHAGRKRHKIIAPLCSTDRFGCEHMAVWFCMAFKSADRRSSYHFFSNSRGFRLFSDFYSISNSEVLDRPFFAFHVSPFRLSSRRRRSIP